MRWVSVRLRPEPIQKNITSNSKQYYSIFIQEHSSAHFHLLSIHSSKNRFYIIKVFATNFCYATTLSIVNRLNKISRKKQTPAEISCRIFLDQLEKVLYSDEVSYRSY